MLLEFMGNKDLQVISQQSDSEEPEINFREIFLVVLKRRWVILAVMLVITTFTAIYTFMQTPLYRSTVTLYIDRLGFSFVPEVVSDTYTWQGYDSFFNTQYKLLKSKSLARRVINRLNLTPADLIPPKKQKTVSSSNPAQDREEQIRALTGSLLA